MFNKQKLTTLILALSAYEKSLAAEDCVALLKENPDAIINQQMLQALTAELEMEIIITGKQDNEIKVVQTPIKEITAKKTIRYLFETSDSISFGDEFYRYVSPNNEDELEFIFNFDDERYEFTTESLDNARSDDGIWSAYCSHNEQDVDIRFYEVKEITA
jgi:hypothetical protein